MTTIENLRDILVLAHQQKIGEKYLRRIVQLLQLDKINYIAAYRLLKDFSLFHNKNDMDTCLKIFEQNENLTFVPTQVILAIRKEGSNALQQVLDSKNIKEITFILEVCSTVSIDSFAKNDVYANALLLDTSIPLEKRKVYFTLIKPLNIYYKNKIVKLIIQAIEHSSIKSATLFSYMLRNKGIRQNKYCLEFISKEIDIVVLDAANRAFRCNRVRKDTEALKELNKLETSYEKISFLNSLYQKYEGQTPEQLAENRRRDRELLELEKTLATLVQDFINARISSSTLEETLNQEPYPLQHLRLRQTDEQYNAKIVELERKLDKALTNYH